LGSLILFVHIVVVAFLVEHLGLVVLLILLVLDVVLVREVPTFLLLVLAIISVVLEIDLVTELLLVGLFWDKGVHLNLQSCLQSCCFGAGPGVLHLELIDGLNQNLLAPFRLDFVVVHVLETVDNFLHELDNVPLRHNIEAFLNYIIAVISLHDLMELLRVAELLDDLILNMAWSPVDALLNELGAKLILREIDEVTFDVLENLFADLVVELLQNF